MKFEFDKNKVIEVVIRFLIEILFSFILKLVSGLLSQNPDDLAYLSFARNPFLGSRNMFL
jgi:hypothetical protein